MIFPWLIGELAANSESLLTKLPMPLARNSSARLGFSDGHNTGLFSWGLLYDYALRQDQLMADYLARLASDGARRN
jgi:DUF971 family protein